MSIDSNSVLYVSCIRVSHMPCICSNAVIKIITNKSCMLYLLLQSSCESSFLLLHWIDFSSQFNTRNHYLWWLYHYTIFKNQQVTIIDSLQFFVYSHLESELGNFKNDQCIVLLIWQVVSLKINSISKFMTIHFKLHRTFRSGWAVVVADHYDDSCVLLDNIAMGVNQTMLFSVKRPDNLTNTKHTWNGRFWYSSD